MKNILQLLCFLMICSNSYAQSWKNLVPNYSFEHHNLSNWNACLHCTNDPQGCGDWLHHYEYMEDYWSVVDNWTLPLQRKWCSSIFEAPVPTADLYHVSCNPVNNARSGETWGHTRDDGEYLIVKTNKDLKSNKMYFLEIFQNGGGHNNRVVAYKNQPVACKYNKNLIEYNANSNHKVLLEFDGEYSGWTRYRTYFSPTTNKSWLSFGRNGTWDDLRIYEVQQNKCRTNWYFDNTVFNYPTEVFQASNNIYVGNGVDPENGSNHIPGDVIQYANSKVVLRAGNQVIIDNTFIMENPNNVLILENSPCKSNLCPDKLHFENQILCNQPSKVIGPEPNNWGTTVHWSPSTYLSNPNVSNPTFTAPSGTGAMEYTVKVTYHCDASEGTHTETKHVLVQFTNINNTTAGVTASNTQYDDYHFSTDLHFSPGVTQFTISIPSYPGYSKTFYKGVDYTCCDFHWELPNAWKWSSCSSDKIEIVTLNKCSGNTSSIQLIWDKSNTPFLGTTNLPNGVTPNGDGINDQLCFNVPSADYYQITVKNLWGNIIYESAGDIKSNPLCFPPFDFVNDGVYYYIIKVSDKCGNKTTDFHYLHVFGSSNNYIPNNLNNEIQNRAMLYNSDVQTDGKSSSYNSKGEKIVLYPNPAKTFFTIKGIIDKYTIQITDEKGKVVPVIKTEGNKINVSNLSKGMYLVHIITPTRIVIKKLVIN